MDNIQVIKYEGDNQTFVYKHPIEDFDSSSQLIVHESQEAIFFLNGKALDLFGPGRYTLETQNIPLLKKFITKTANNVSPFHCEIYFINKVEQMAIKWGTSSRIEFIEPTYGFPLSLGCSGNLSLKVIDSRNLLENIVGTIKELTQENLVNYFKSFLNAKLKSYLAKTIKQNKISIFELDENLVDFSSDVKKLLEPDFESYGLELVTFFITDVVRPDNERTYEHFKELHFRKYADVAEAQLKKQTSIIKAEAEAQQKIIDSQAEAEKRRIEGYSYRQQRSLDIAEKMASNQSQGQYTNLGIGLATMSAVGGKLGKTLNEALNSDENKNNNQIQCPKCHTLNDAKNKFCCECGASLQKNRCKKCNTEVDDNVKFCPNCGAKIK